MKPYVAYRSNHGPTGYNPSLLYIAIGRLKHIAVVFSHICASLPPIRFLRRQAYRFSAILLALVICWYTYGVYSRYCIFYEAEQLLGNLPEDKCPVVDDRNTVEIGQAIHDFVRFEMPKNSIYDGIEVYPWVLTMLAALRFGGNAVHDGENLFVTDHDIDIILSRQDLSKAAALQLQRDLVSYIEMKCGVWTHFEPEPEGGRHGSLAFLFRMSHWSQIGWWQLASGYLADNLRRPYRSVLGKLISYFVDVSLLRSFIGSPVWAHLTVIDFHRHSTAIPAHESRKVLWANRSWPYLKNESQYVEYFDSYVSRPLRLSIYILVT